jgi:hypothetical protein
MNALLHGFASELPPWRCKGLLRRVSEFRQGAWAGQRPDPIRDGGTVAPIHGEREDLR